MILLRFFCWLNEIWIFLRTGSIISGHSYIEIKNTKNEHILKCEVCGYISKAEHYFEIIG